MIPYSIFFYMAISFNIMPSRFIHMGTGVREGSFESPGESLVIVSDAVSRLGVGCV